MNPELKSILEDIMGGLCLAAGVVALFYLSSIR